MAEQLRESDAHILAQIVDHATHHFLRESSANRRPVFNIIPMLSSYRSLSHQFALRKETIYNWIMLITKQYHPQSARQWLSAIRELMNASPRHHQFEKSHEKVPRVNTSSNEFYHDSRSFNQSKITSHNSTTRLNSQWEIGKLKDFSSSGSRDQIDAPLSCKMHHISFEPDKENVNSENMRIEDQPTRTPVEQSFIMQLPNSTGSPFYLSKITHNTKDATYIGEQTLIDEEWENMKARADIFYSINSMMKAFSALMANFQAFEQYQILKRKAHMFARRTFGARLIHNWQLNRFESQSSKQILAQVRSLNRTKLQKKAFRVLKVLYELRVEGDRKQHFDLCAANPVNFDFLISLMLCPLTRSEQTSPASSRVSMDTPKSIRHKARYFQETENSEKIQLIVQYFSHNLRLSKEQITALFMHQQKSRMRKCFQILSKNSKRENLSPQIVQLRKKTALRIWRDIYNHSTTAQSHLLMMRTVKSRKLKQKCFRALHEISLSKKLYAKREEYLRSKSNRLIQRVALETWMNRLQLSKIKKLSYSKRVLQGWAMVQRTIGSKYFHYMLDRLAAETGEERRADEVRIETLQSAVFAYLKERVIQKKHFLQIRENQKIRTLKAAVKRWSHQSSLSQAVSRLNVFSLKSSFMAVKTHSEMALKIARAQTYLEVKAQYRGLRQLRTSYHLDRALETKKIQKTQGVLKINYMDEFISSVRLIAHEINEAKAKDRLMTSTAVLSNFLRDYGRRRVVSAMKANYINCQSYKQKIVILQRAINQQAQDVDPLPSFDSLSQRSARHRKITFLQTLRSDYELAQASVRLKQSLAFSRTRLALRNQFRTTQIVFHQKNKAKIIVNKREKETKRCVFQNIKNRIQDNHKKVAHMESKINKRLIFSGMMGLAKMVMRKDKRCLKVEEMLNERRQIDYGTKLIASLRQNTVLKKKIEHLSLKINFSRFVAKSGSQDQLGPRVQLIKILRKSPLIRNLQLHMTIETERYKWLQQREWNFKKIGVMKLHEAIIREMLRRKETYMAIKFRAMKLLKQSFEILMDKKRSARTFAKNSIGVEHFSTEYSYI